VEGRECSSTKLTIALPYLFHPFASYHAEDANDDEWYAEKLAHVKEHAFLKIHLVDLCKFYEETGSEDKRETQSEKETCAGLLRPFAIESPSHKEEY
jgi:hypothetical protein